MAQPTGMAQPDASQNMSMDEIGRFHTTICAKKKKSITARCELEEKCPFSHCLSWHRRNPFQYPYRPNLCPNVLFWTENGRMRVKSYCHRGRLCMFSHTKEEQMYHPLVYKTQLCRDWPTCKKYFCPFAHGLEELRNPEKIDFFPLQGPELLELPVRQWRAATESALNSISDASPTLTSASASFPTGQNFSSRHGLEFHLFDDWENNIAQQKHSANRVSKVGHQMPRVAAGTSEKTAYTPPRFHHRRLHTAFSEQSLGTFRGPSAGCGIQRGRADGNCYVQLNANCTDNVPLTYHPDYPFLRNDRLRNFPPSEPHHRTFAPVVPPPPPPTPRMTPQQPLPLDPVAASSIVAGCFPTSTEQQATFDNTNSLLGSVLSYEMLLSLQPVLSALLAQTPSTPSSNPCDSSYTALPPMMNQHFSSFPLRDSFPTTPPSPRQFIVPPPPLPGLDESLPPPGIMPHPPSKLDSALDDNCAFLSTACNSTPIMGSSLSSSGYSTPSSTPTGLLHDDSRHLFDSNSPPAPDQDHQSSFESFASQFASHGISPFFLQTLPQLPVVQRGNEGAVLVHGGDEQATHYNYEEKPTKEKKLGDGVSFSHTNSETKLFYRDRSTVYGSIDSCSTEAWPVDGRLSKRTSSMGPGLHMSLSCLSLDECDDEKPLPPPAGTSTCAGLF